MLTRLLLPLGLICLLLWLVGRAALMLATPPAADLRFTVPGEALLAGLDAADVTVRTAAGAVPALTPLPTVPLTALAERAITVTPLPLATPTTGCFTYTVRAGDTLSALAQRFDTGVVTILRDNQLTAAPRVRAGQRLAICAGPSALPLTALPRYRVYQVQPGDTLPGVALRFGLPVYTVAQANNLPLSARLYRGQLVRLPDDGLVPLGTILLPANPTDSASAAQASAPNTPAPASGPAPRRVPVPQATEVVHLAWPRQAPLDQPATIRLGFGRTAPLPEGGPLAGLGQPTATPLPIFRADRAVLAAYEGEVVARLAVVSAEVSLLTPDAQPLTQADMGWTWRLSPRQTGRYPAQVSLETRWTPRDGGSPIVHTVWQQPLEIEIVQPPLPGWLSNLLGVGGAVLTILGAALGRWQPPANQTPMKTTIRRF
ncbi:MAG: LysM peptidoglycan-binding domain-containing protein [Anaerolineae bacterium]|nr:LysM peptidoglycan-binding domain-containing protein [Anaerolineae bacterium]